MKKIKPMGTRLLVKPDKIEDEVRPSGVVIPEGVKPKPQTGTILGIGVNVEGKYQKGDKVIFSKYSDIVFRWGEEEVAFVDEADILGVIK